jgi:hypothetical protein
MLRGTSVTLRILAHTTRHAGLPFSTSAVAASTQPNTALNLDPSLKALLQDIDISLTSHKQIPVRRSPRELQAFAVEELEETVDVDVDVAVEDPFEDSSERNEHRKSPAARFGSKKIGAVVLPAELQASVTALINGVLGEIVLYTF